MRLRQGWLGSASNWKAALGVEPPLMAMRARPAACHRFPGHLNKILRRAASQGRRIRLHVVLDSEFSRHG